jgi:hypothetical protein
VARLLADLGWSAAARIDLGDTSVTLRPRAVEHFIFLSKALMEVLRTTGYGIAVQREP